MSSVMMFCQPSRRPTSAAPVTPAAGPACEPVCPVTAISYEDDVPAEWKQFTPINAEFFGDQVTGLGSPGGAAQVGRVQNDHPTVAAWAAA